MYPDEVTRDNQNFYRFLVTNITVNLITINLLFRLKLWILGLQDAHPMVIQGFSHLIICKSVFPSFRLIVCVISAVKGMQWLQ